MGKEDNGRRWRRAKEKKGKKVRGRGSKSRRKYIRIGERMFLIRMGNTNIG